MTKKTIRAATAVLAGVVALAFALCRLNDLPAPHTMLLLASGLVPPARTPQLFDATEIARPAQAHPFEEAPARLAVNTAWRGGQNVPLDDFLALTHTRAFLVVHRGRLVVERYFDGATQDTRFPSFSLSKSIISGLVGIASERQLISVQDRLEKFLPPSALDPAYRNVTVEQLLDMRSGIDVAENYDSLAAPIVQMYLSTDLDRFIAGRHGLRFTPGSAFEYRSVDYQVLGRVLAAATGMPVSRYLEQALWTPLGAEQGASWSVDSARHGVEKAFCCFNATARDFAKLGALYLNQGAWQGRQLMAPNWFAAQDQPTGLDERRGLGYRKGWWIPPGDRADHDYFAGGIHGQFIYVNPARSVVIVKLSEHEVEADILLSIAAFQETARRIDRQEKTPASD